MRVKKRQALGTAAGVLVAFLFANAMVPSAAVTRQSGCPPWPAQWMRQFGNPGGTLPWGISVDVSGVYVVGYTEGTFPGQTSAGPPDAFVRKYDTEGNEVWTRQFGSTYSASDGADGISVSASGVYVFGYTFGALPGQINADDSLDVFVRKYDTAGNVVWTRQFGTSEHDRAFGISVDASGVYLVGTTPGVLPGQTSAGASDAFVRKYDTAGNVVWTRQFGGASSDVATAVSVDASGVYLTGVTFGALPGQTNAGPPDAFVRKYDTAGNVVWTRQFGTASYDGGFGGISVDVSGVYVVGYTEGTFPGQTSAGPADAFVRKYDTEGNEVWTRQFGTPRLGLRVEISVDASGVYIAGDQDALVRKYDTEGNQVWTWQFGTLIDPGTGISVDASGVYVTGFTPGVLPGQTKSGALDGFVVKLRSVLTPQEAIQALICQVEAFNLKQGISNSLDAKLEAAEQALQDMNVNNNAAAVNALQALINLIEAQRGSQISNADADALIAAARAVIAQVSGGNIEAVLLPERESQKRPEFALYLPRGVAVTA